MLYVAKISLFMFLSCCMLNVLMWLCFLTNSLALNHWALDFAATAADRRDTEPMVPLMEGIEDDAFEEVEESQATIQSVGGFSVDTQDSLTFEKSPFQCGNIKFVRDAYDSQGYQVTKMVVVKLDFSIELVND